MRWWIQDISKKKILLTSVYKTEKIYVLSYYQLFLSKICDFNLTTVRYISISPENYSSRKWSFLSFLGLNKSGEKEDIKKLEKDEETQRINNFGIIDKRIDDVEQIDKRTEHFRKIEEYNNIKKVENKIYSETDSSIKTNSSDFTDSSDHNLTQRFSFVKHGVPVQSKPKTIERPLAQLDSIVKHEREIREPPKISSKPKVLKLTNKLNTPAIDTSPQSVGTWLNSVHTKEREDNVIDLSGNLIEDVPQKNTSSKNADTQVEVSFSKTSKKERKAKIPNQKIQKNYHLYPLWGKGVSKPVFTHAYCEMKTFLETLKIRTDELQYYPAIQLCGKIVFLECVEELKAEKIHNVFSLYLIQRCLTNRSKFKLGQRSPIKGLPNASKYVELCAMLKRPDLDILQMIDDLSALQIYVTLRLIYTMTKKLLALGATPEEIWSDIRIYQITKFPKMIKFVALGKFGNKDINYLEKTFRGAVYNRIHILRKLAILLEVKTWDILTVLSVDSEKELRKKALHLYYVSQLLIKAEVPKNDIFQNLNVLKNLSFEKISSTVKTMKKEDWPLSINILHDFSSAVINDGDQRNDNKGKNVIEKEEGVDILLAIESRRSQQRFIQQAFKLIRRGLNIKGSDSMMLTRHHVPHAFDDLTDILKNFEYLLQQYSIEDLKTCPIIFANNHKQLRRYNQTVLHITAQYLYNLQKTSSSFEIPADFQQFDFSKESINSFDETTPTPFIDKSICDIPTDKSTIDWHSLDDNTVAILISKSPLSFYPLSIPNYRLLHTIYKSPLKKLNTVQYWIEKNNNLFYLNHSSGTSAYSVF